MSAPPLAQLTVAAALVEDLLREARDAAVVDQEAVGLVVAPVDHCNDPASWVTWRLDNEAADPARTYHVSPEALREAWERLQRAGMGIMAMYHSHLRRAANPSTDDVAGAWLPRQFIVFPGARHRDSMVKLWWIEDGTAVQIPLVEV